MISLPNTGTIQAEIQDDTINQIYHFNGINYETLLMTNNDTLDPYKGYWIKTLNPNVTINLDYIDIYQEVNTVNVPNKGWYMISLPKLGTIQAEIQDDTINQIYHFNGINYETLLMTNNDTLDPYKGYWIKTLNPNVTINITYI